ncbi:MAG: succinate dehydrogenase/fumarate reductase flavoprotein subunit, partial [Clostridia bacterium]|nr:succinate dehydrogenase/fumarate reductase flavoprotein subunit [Clostridia bacterium]
LLDIIVFGRHAGQQAGARFRDIKVGKLSLEHVKKYDEELKAAGIDSEILSPKLFPDYARKVNA